MSEKRVVKKVLYVNNTFPKIDDIHYEIENINLMDEITLVNGKLKELQEHLTKQANKIKRIEKFDCDKVKELPSEIINFIKEFMSDDIETIRKAECIFRFFMMGGIRFRFGFPYSRLEYQEQYIYHIFKKYDRKKLWRFIMRHRLLSSADYPISKSTAKYELVKYIYKGIKIEDFDWKKGLIYQTNYTFNENPLEYQYKIYQILKIASKSPQPLT